MIRRVHLDFETRSELDLSGVGSAVYAAHPSTEILCFAYAVDDKPVQQVKRLHVVDKEVLDYECRQWRELRELAADPDVIFVAHNALFEQMIWRYIMVLRYRMPEIPITRWRCTAAKAATYALPRKLEKACNALNLPIRKDMEGNKVMLKLAKPRARLSKANQQKFWEPSKNPEDFETLYSYNRTDVEVERVLDKSLRELRPLEQEIWFMDQRMNQHGLTLDLEAVSKALKFLDIAAEELIEQFRIATNGAVEKPSQRDKFVNWIQEQGVSMPDLTAPTIDRMLARHKDDPYLPQNVVTALQIRRQLGRTSTGKYKAMMDRVSADGRLRDILLYYGAARTGRWSGRGVQPQNFVRPKCDIYKAVEALMKYDYEMFCLIYKPMDTLAEIIRGMIIATIRMMLFVADFSAVEARVTAWVAGEEDLLQAFRDGTCPYCQLATTIYNKPIDKKENPEERQVGKVGILALGYQGGINAFATMADTYRLEMAPVHPYIWPTTTPEEREKALKAYRQYRHTTDEPISEEGALAADIVKQRYRLKYTKIVRLWYDVEDAAVAAIETGRPVKCSKVTFFVSGEKVDDPKIKCKAKEPGLVFSVEGQQYVRTASGVCYRWDTYFLNIKLPSGRCLNYHKPELYDTKTPWGQTKKQVMYMGVDDKNRYALIETYGGKWVENIVQAIARDLMAEAFLRIEKAGYTPLLQVHDEAISEAPIGFGSVEEYEALMEEVPPWAEGLPVKAEGWSGPRYKKG